VAVSPRLSRIARRTALAALALFVAAALTEHVLEVLDTARLTTDDTFCSVHDRRIRYRLTGAGKPGPTVVLISGAGGTIEQWHNVEDPLAASSPVLTYDRGGLGFSDAADVHDPDGLAGELGDLLQALELPPPYVVVSYSSSSLLARLFVGHHKAEVKGVVLLDPILPGAQLVGRRVLISMRLKALVGITRFKGYHWNHPVMTRREEKEQAVLASYHHWSAVAAEGMDLGDWTPSLMAAPAFAPIPVRALCTFDEVVDGRSEAAVTNTRLLAAESPHGTFLALHHVKHSELLTDPAAFPIAIDAIRSVENQARELANQGP
jgi:pimeloyl-ACP methyl ester carboxylesterase